MFNMVRVGSKISELRKAHNLTQMELADRMQISFQAVSNWERGVSMPDIAKLPELADLFGVSIDDLLGQKSALLESVLQDKSADYLQNNTITAGQFQAIAPLIKPDQADEILANAKPPFQLSEILDVLPFVSTEVANQLARKLADNGEYESLDDVAPFVDQEVLDTIARKMLSEGKRFERFFPFLSTETLAQLATSIYKKQGISALDSIAPFLPQDVLVQIAKWEYANHGLKHFEAIAPFLDKTMLSEFIIARLLVDAETRMDF